MEAYLEDNRPTIDEICKSYDECNKECPLYRFCHPQKSEEISDHNLKMWHDIYAEEKRRERSDKE